MGLMVGSRDTIEFGRVLISEKEKRGVGQKFLYKPPLPHYKLRRVIFLKNNYIRSLMAQASSALEMRVIQRHNSTK